MARLLCVVAVDGVSSNPKDLQAWWELKFQDPNVNSLDAIIDWTQLGVPFAVGDTIVSTLELSLDEGADPTSVFNGILSLKGVRSGSLIAAGPSVHSRSDIHTLGLIRTNV